MEASGNGWTRETLAGTIDSTLLHPGATPEDIRRLCKEATDYHFASVCVNPCYVAFAAEHLSGSDVAVCTVVGFPLGANLSDVKLRRRSSPSGMALGNSIWCSTWDFSRRVTLRRGGGHPGRHGMRPGRARVVKVIIEACLLDDGEKVAACGAVERAGALFVKTSTGSARAAPRWRMCGSCGALGQPHGGEGVGGHP
jgi:deoxyribose-phosphate aldolase